MKLHYTRVGLIALLTAVISVFCFVVISPKAYFNNLGALQTELPKVQANKIVNPLLLHSQIVKQQKVQVIDLEHANGTETAKTAHPFQYFVLAPTSINILQRDYQQFITTRVLRMQQVKRQISRQQSQIYRFSFKHQPESDHSLDFS